MEITIMGYIIIPLSIVLFFFKKDYLLYLTVFFSGFTSSSIINFGSSFSLQPSYLFIILFVIKWIFEIFYTGKIILPNKFLLLFFLWCTLSLFMPWVLKDEHIVRFTIEAESTYLKFGMDNVTQYLYLVLCVLVYWVFKDYLIKRPVKIEKVLKIYAIGAVAIFFICVYQVISISLGLPFDEIFRSGVHGSVQSGRIYGVAGEPSMLAYYIAPTMFLIFFMNNNTVTNNKLIAILLFVIGILSTSTTFLLAMGIGLILLLLFYYKKIFKFDFWFKEFKKNKWVIVFGIIAILGLTIIIINNEVIYERLIIGAIKKFQKKNISGIERRHYFEMMILIGLKYPFFGIGFGSSRSTDLFSTWLANIGVLGLGMYVLYIYDVVRNLIKMYKKTQKLIFKGWVFYIIVLTICAFVSVPEPYYLFIWIGFAISESMVIIEKRKLKLEE